MRLLLLSLLIASVAGLYEDQVGKFDWRAKHIGCPNQIQFDRSVTGQDYLIVSSHLNAIASINVNNGDLDWRQVNEIQKSSSPSFVIYKPSEKQHPYVASLVNDGEYIRVFHRSNGALKWQHKLMLQAHTNKKLVVAGKTVVIVSDNKVIAYSAQSGKQKASAELPAASLVFADGVFVDDNIMRLVLVTGPDAVVYDFDTATSALKEVATVNLNGVAKKCILTGTVLACQDSTNAISALDIKATNIVKSDLIAAADANIQSIGVHGFFAVSSPSKLLIYKHDNGKLDQILESLPTTVLYATKDLNNKKPLLVLYYDIQRVAKVYDLSNGKEMYFSVLEPLQQAPVTSIALLSVGQSVQMLTVRADCRMDLYEVQTNDSGKGKKATLEWSRFEALASISSAEMVDLPLSESQARIETEFSVRDPNIVKTFILRITTQIEELHRSAITFFERAVQSLDLFFNHHVSLPIVMRNFLGDDSAVRRMKKPRPGSSVPLEASDLQRDYFNLRKVIVVTTLSGSVYGLNNEDGSVIWSLYLGDDAVPLKSELAAEKVSLFIQRGTAFYQFKSQAVVVFGVKFSTRNRFIVFNPITGQQTDTFERNGVKRIELLPFVDEEMLHPILTIDGNDKLEFFPNVKPDSSQLHAISLFFIDSASGKMSGSLVDFKKKTLVPTWKTSPMFTSNEKLVAVAGKSAHQRVHSQGKVLGDRSVLYKYSNPNLVAAMSYDSDSSTLTVRFVDAVTGQTVHTARQSKVRGPFKMVHCENWLVYTYWNEKSRRTELAIIELYEGAEQSNADNFNSLTTTKMPLEVASKAFVFSQGVSALQASETEQGLSTRSMIIAMPFGGIIEISKRFIDARRPLEMTPELREEMIIPYMPELPVATEELINYNQTAVHIHGIKTAPSGLESTSLMLAYGMDMFYTRVTPSGTFDILKDDFDYVLISGVMVVLVAASFVVKRIWRQNNLKQAWA